MKKYQALSPDGFTIEFDKHFYETKKEMIKSFETWKKRYETQGYYSSNNGQIPLNQLEKHCTFNTITY